MVLVAYSDSSGDEVDEEVQPAKKRKISPQNGEDELPPLPTAFLDLYSSTTRTSTQDDPSLHGGRQRVTPHVEGHWPTHVYLEWHPQPAEAQALAALIAAQNEGRAASSSKGDVTIHSLLQNELGVELPLHVSLSRPLVLKTEQREPFLDQLRKGVQSSGVRAFLTRPRTLIWHPNEAGSRWFHVLGLRKREGDELYKLLNASNAVAKSFGQPLLYSEDTTEHGVSDADAARTAGRDPPERFHISIAWSLSAPPLDMADVPARLTTEPGDSADAEDVDIFALLEDTDIAFSEVKVRIGQDVTTILLPAARGKGLFT